MDYNLELIAAIAGTLTTISFLPQTIKTIRTRETKAISFIMYLLFTIGCGFWLFFGVVINNYSIIIANSLTLLLAFIILVIKMMNLKKDRETI